MKRPPPKILYYLLHATIFLELASELIEGVLKGIGNRQYIIIPNEKHSMNKENTVVYRGADPARKLEEPEPQEKKVLLDKGQIALKEKSLKI